MKNCFSKKSSIIPAIVAIVIVAGTLAGCQKESIDDLPFLDIMIMGGFSIICPLYVPCCIKAR